MAANKHSAVIVDFIKARSPSGLRLAFIRAQNKFSGFLTVEQIVQANNGEWFMFYRRELAPHGDPLMTGKEDNTQQEGE